MVLDTSESMPPTTGFDYEKVRGYNVTIEYLTEPDTGFKSLTRDKYYSVAGIKLELNHRYL